MNIGNERLLKLATHLESGKLGHERFDFGQYNSTSEPVCGTAGCAIGECPFLFPEDWKFGCCGLPYIENYSGPISSARMFFDLSQRELDQLFIPVNPASIRKTSSRLTENATAAQVAANIRSFVEKRKG